MKKNLPRILITVVLFFLFALVLLFFLHNKSDIVESFKARGSLDYTAMKESCPVTETSSYVDCFFIQIEEFMKKRSLTGVSVALNWGFEFLEEDKKNSKQFEDGIIKDVFYSLQYLKLNNLALKYAKNSFQGFNFLYGFYLSGLYDFYSKAFDFSDNMIKGIESTDGLIKIDDEPQKNEFNESFQNLKNDYHSLKDEVENFLEKEKLRLSNV